jgi:hypothetical protein
VCLAVGTAQAAGARGAATPARCAAPGSYKGAEARRFLADCLLCALLGMRGVADTYHVPKATPNALARALAERTAPRVLRKAVQAGCMRGFRFASSSAKAKGNGKAPGKGPPAATTTGHGHG